LRVGTHQQTVAAVVFVTDEVPGTMAHPVRNDGTRHVCHTNNDGGNGDSGRGMNSLGIHRSIRSRKIVLFSVVFLGLYIVRSIPFDCRFVV